MGDFNINLLKSNSNSSHASFRDIFGQNGRIMPTIILPTRISRTSRTQIDNIFLSSSSYSSISGNITVGISDYLPQFLFLKSHLLKQNLFSAFLEIGPSLMKGYISKNLIRTTEPNCSSSSC